MAQFYKMTLYVCDLEESLSMDEIKVLIAERALDGCSISAICHFANEQIGEQIKWDDDVDINQCGCPTSAWDKYFKPPTQEQTNADRIRVMSDEEIAQWLCLNYSCTKCPGQNLCTIDGGKHNGLTKWLKQPAEGE